MKKFIAFLLALVCVLSMVGCNQQKLPNTTNVDPGVFSYAEDCAIYVDGEPGAKTSGFVNTFETEINHENVVEHAKNECTIEYDSVEVCLDATEYVWRVLFYTQGVLGGCQTVYMDYDGKTILIVYGE